MSQWAYKFAHGHRRSAVASRWGEGPRDFLNSLILLKFWTPSCVCGVGLFAAAFTDWGPDWDKICPVRRYWDICLKNGWGPVFTFRPARTVTHVTYARGAFIFSHKYFFSFSRAVRIVMGSRRGMWRVAFRNSVPGVPATCLGIFHARRCPRVSSPLRGGLGNRIKTHFIFCAP